MFVEGVYEVSTCDEAARTTLARTAGFQNADDYIEALHAIDKKVIEWGQTLAEGMALAYTNGVAVWYGWRHLRRKKKEQLPLVFTGAMIVRSQLIMRASVPKNYGARVVNTQSPIRALRMTMGKTLTDVPQTNAVNIKEVQEHIGLMKTFTSYSTYGSRDDGTHG